MKTVTLPIEEYNELLRDQEDKKRLMRELEADAKERGFFMQEVTNVWDKPDGPGWGSHYAYIVEKSRLMIVAKDKVLAKAQKELERLEKLATEQAEEIATLTARINILQNRSLWDRIFNRHD